METVAPQETLARFAIEKTYFRPSDGTVRHNAFLPSRDCNSSVFRISGLAEAEIWDIGNTHVALPRDKPLLGRAEIIAQHVLDNKLGVEPAEPPPRHANIVGWPDDKAARRQIAQELAALARFYLR